MVKVIVPATSANLGSGFDALGIALNLYSQFVFEETEDGLEIVGCEDKYKNEGNLIYTSMLKTFERVGYKAKGIKITINSEIPVSRGLGSSASCILAGVIGGNELSGKLLSRKEIFKLATEIEGHPDNIAPALFGGLVTSIMEDGDIQYNHIDIANGLKFIALIPDFKLSTNKSREVLPKTIAYSDAVFNIGRVSLMLSALSNGKFELLKYGLQDKMHQQYRGELIHNYGKIISKCDTMNSFGTYLSGAGPTIMVLVDQKENNFIMEIEEYLSQFKDKWEVKELGIDFNGARIL